MKTSLLIFVCIFASIEADVSHISKKYLPAKTETTNKLEQNDAETVEATPNIKENVNEGANEEPTYPQAQPKQSSALTETQVTTTTFIPCTSVNGAPCVPNNGFYPGPNVFPGGGPPGFYPGFGPGAYPGGNFGPPTNFYPYGGQQFLNRPGQFPPNFPGSLGPQVFPENMPGGFFPGGPPLLPGQNFAAGQNFEAGSNFVVGQNNLPGQGPFLGQGPFPGQAPFPGQGPFLGQGPFPGGPPPFPGQSFFPRAPIAGNGFDSSIGEVPAVVELIPESYVRTASDTEYAADGGYLYQKPLNAALLH